MKSGSRWLGHRMSAFLCILVMAACSDGSSSGGAALSTSPPPQPPPTQSVAPPPPVLPTSCADSQVVVAATPGPLQGTYSAHTDASGKSLLITNLSLETLVVYPDGVGTSLQPTPDLNPTDIADVSALNALADSNLASVDRNLPVGVPVNQIYIVPPKYSVCGTVADATEEPRVRIGRDRFASVAWRTTMTLAEHLTDKVTPTVLKTAQAMKMCFDGAVTLAVAHPDFSDFALYSDTLETGSNCYKSYTALIAEQPNEESTADKSASTIRELVEDVLDKSAKLINDAHFFLVLEH